MKSVRTSIGWSAAVTLTGLVFAACGDGPDYRRATPRPVVTPIAVEVGQCVTDPSKDRDFRVRPCTDPDAAIVIGKFDGTQMGGSCPDNTDLQTASGDPVRVILCLRQRP